MELDADTAKATLDKLIADGLLTQEQVLTAMRYSPTPQMKVVVDLIHTAFCRDSHDGTCRYYDEEKADACWQMEEHQEWFDFTTNIIFGFNMKGVADLKIALKDANKIFADIIKLDNARFVAYYIREQIERELPTVCDERRDGSSVTQEQLPLFPNISSFINDPL